MINLDLDDLKPVFKDAGMGAFGTGSGSGEKGWLTAVEGAVSLLGKNCLTLGRHFMINITGGLDFSLDYVAFVGGYLHDLIVDPDSDIVLGAIIDPEMTEKNISVSIIATGISMPAVSGIAVGGIVDNVYYSPLETFARTTICRVPAPHAAGDIDRQVTPITLSKDILEAPSFLKKGKRSSE
jgi:cell division GTPase FtsZ